MKGLKNGFLWAVTIASVSACASYRIGATFEDGGRPYFGEVSVMMGGGGTVDLQSEDGRNICKGATQIVERPYGTTIGARGHAEGKCTDGRTFKVDFVQTRSRGGSGRGIASDGSIVKVYFDASGDVVRSQMKLDHLNSLVK